MYTGFNLARSLKMLIVALGGIAPIWFIAWIFGFALKKLGGTEKIIYSSLYLFESKLKSTPILAFTVVYIINH